MRGVAVEVKVEPTTERDGWAPGLGNDIEVIKICGIRYCSCSVVTACFKVSMSKILTPESVLNRSVPGASR
jgi:hypothetical protein